MEDGNEKGQNTSPFPGLYKVSAGRIMQNPKQSVVFLKETHTVGQLPVA